MPMNMTASDIFSQHKTMLKSNWKSLIMKRTRATGRVSRMDYVSALQSFKMILNGRSFVEQHKNARRLPMTAGSWSDGQAKAYQEGRQSP